MKDEGWKLKDEGRMLKDEGLRLKGVLRTNELTNGQTELVYKEQQIFDWS